MANKYTRIRILFISLNVAISLYQHYASINLYYTFRNYDLFNNTVIVELQTIGCFVNYDVQRKWKKAIRDLL